MNKFDRVVSILMQLQTKKIVRAQDLADKFEVSLRTIYRDLRTLEKAGVPIHAEAGIGYSLVDGYSLPPVMFTTEEATSFLVAEKLVEKMTDSKTSAHFGHAVAKIKAILRGNEKEQVDSLENHIHVAERLSSQVEFNEESIQLILGCVTSKTALEITYNAIYSKKRTTRKIEPIGIVFYSSYWHLIAYCHLRNAYRDFRIDRIEDIQSLSDRFEKEHPSLIDYLEQVATEQDLHQVEVHFDKEMGEYARTQKYFYGFVLEEEDDRHIKMHFLTPSLHGMAHWLLIYTNHIRIIEPPELIEEMKKLTNDLAKNYLT